MFIMTNKNFLPEEQMHNLRSRLLEMDENKFAALSSVQLKSPTTILIIAIFLGQLGVDRFMTGSTGPGVGKLLTLGACGIWWLIDIFSAQNRTRQYNWDKLQMML